MGVYERRSTRDNILREDGTETWVEESHWPGVTMTREVTAGPWTEERTDCFCCSCYEDNYGTHEGSDPHCRNHGWAGRRPCKDHNMPGTADDDGDMPISVQAENARKVL